MTKLGDLISQTVWKKITHELVVEEEKIPLIKSNSATLNNDKQKYRIEQKPSPKKNNPTELSYSEKVLLKKHYLRATSLESGTRHPISKTDKHFVLVCKGRLHL
jgi:hypothetical protein